MIKRSIQNFLAVTVMVFMTVFIALFLYSNIHLKNKVTLQIVQEMEFISDVFAKAILDIMSDGHDKETYSVLLGYSNLMGVEDIGIYKLTGEEAFQAPSLRPDSSKIIRKIGPADKNFWKVTETMKMANFFDHDKFTYTRYVPLRSEGACFSCHMEKTPLGIFRVSFSVKSHFETLKRIQQFIWALGLIAALPVAGLFISGVIIRDKNRLYSQLEEANNDLKATYNNLIETKYYLQLILDNSKALIITTDTEGKIVEFNREAETLLEYKKKDAAGKDVLMLYENPEQRKAIIPRSGFKDGSFVVRNREVTLRSKSGKLLYINLTLSTLVNDKGMVIGTVGIGKDISEQKMLQFKLIQSEKLAGIGTLASGIAHEINNPLAGILGMAEAIRDEDDTGIIKSYANDIIHYATDAGKIVKELSKYSRSAHIEAQSTVDLSVVVEGSLKLVKHATSLTSIEVVQNLEKDSLILANASEMQQVFMNLIINAIHAMNDGGGRLIINCLTDGKFVKATVSDTGHGIPREHISRIYDPFFTTKPTGKGTGLGLYIVYRIVTKYGGSIDVKSTKGEGTTFTLKFPAVDDEQNSTDYRA